MGPAVQFDHVSCLFDGVTALNGVSFALYPCEIVALVGPNGSGKSTILNILSGFVRPQNGVRVTGSARIKGKSVIGLPPYEISALGLARSFQIPRVFRQMPVADNVRVAIEDPKSEGVYASVLAGNRGNIDVSACLAFGGLSQRMGEEAGDLSTGQVKLLEVLRTVAMARDIYALDEPTASLHSGLQDVVIDKLRVLAKQGKTILLVEHNMDVVRRCATRVLFLDAGRIISQGTPAEALASEAVRLSSFLG